MKKLKADIWASITFFLAFIGWTFAVFQMDVRSIGPENSEVGMAAINSSFHNLTGVHMELYLLTDWLSLLPLVIVLFFGVTGLFQWIKRKSIRKVDRSILALGGFYLAVIGTYMYFEMHVINYRPVLIEGFLESSYPSSTTMLVLCVMLTAAMEFHSRIKSKRLRHGASFAIIGFTVFMVIGRLLSGVHWVTDIIGGALLSAGLVTLYHAVSIS